MIESSLPQSMVPARQQRSTEPIIVARNTNKGQMDRPSEPVDVAGEGGEVGAREDGGPGADDGVQHAVHVRVDARQGAPLGGPREVVPQEAQMPARCQEGRPAGLPEGKKEDSECG